MLRFVLEWDVDSQLAQHSRVDSKVARTRSMPRQGPADQASQHTHRHAERPFVFVLERAREREAGRCLRKVPAGHGNWPTGPSIAGGPNPSESCVTCATRKSGQSPSRGQLPDLRPAPRTPVPALDP